MKTATVRELRNHYSRILEWVSKGLEVEVTRRGKVVAKVVPATPPARKLVDWTSSAALRPKTWSRTLTAAESAALLAESQARQALDDLH